MALILAATLGAIAAIAGAGVWLLHRSGMEGSQITSRPFHGGGWILATLIAVGAAAGVGLTLRMRRP